MAENGTSTASRQGSRKSSNGSGPSTARNGKPAAKRASQTPAKAKAKANAKTNAKPSATAETASAQGGLSEAVKMTAVAGSSALLGLAGGYAGAIATGKGGSGRSTPTMPKLKTATSLKLIAGAGKLGYKLGRTREKAAQV